MLPAQLDYHAASSLDEAIRQLEAHPNAQVLAGGTDLLPALMRRRATAGTLVDLHGVPGLTAISPMPDGGIRLGALATLTAIAETRELAGSHPALLEAIAGIGDPQVRNRATLGGSLAQHRPGGDLAAVLLACNAVVTIMGPSGQRTVGSDELLAGAEQARLAPTEILTEAELPGGCMGSAYERFRDAASGYAICGVATLVRLAQNGTIGECRLALTGATTAITRLTALETGVIGQAPTAATRDISTAQAKLGGLTFVDDRVASGEYRAHLTGVLATRALRRALERAGRGQSH
jgi:carbon-monoxide dehydrogenase medium subunit